MQKKIHACGFTLNNGKGIDATDRQDALDGNRSVKADRLTVTSSVETFREKPSIEPDQDQWLCRQSLADRQPNIQGGNQHA